MRPLLLIALLSLCACAHGRLRPIVSGNAVEDLESSAADELRCKDLEVRPLTLLTRLVDGCGHQRVYAFEPLREQWVLDSVERR